jgi:hypothetical protein
MYDYLITFSLKLYMDNKVTFRSHVIHVFHTEEKVSWETRTLNGRQ